MFECNKKAFWTVITAKIHPVQNEGSWLTNTKTFGKRKEISPETYREIISEVNNKDADFEQK